MDVIRRFAKPALQRPRAVVAFEGWNDACEAATGSIEFLLRQTATSEPFAVIDPEEFFDFQVRRPVVSMGEGGTRSLSWPTTKFFAVETPGDEPDLVLVLGEEPSFRWRTFARHVTQLLVEMDVEETVLLGAFVGRVAHTRPVPVVGVATEPEQVIGYGLSGSTYEGPTGIVGVLQEAFREVGVPAISLWAATPHYLAANPNPKAMLALIEHTTGILDLGTDLTGLEEAAADFDERVGQAMAASGDLAEYVAGLENHDATPDTVALDPALTDDLVKEIESFLRDQPG